MGHDVAQRGGLAKCWRNLEVEILVYVRVQIQLALLNLLHHRRPSERLRDGAWAEKRILRRHWRFLLGIGVAVAFLEENFSIFHDSDDGAGDVGLLNLLRHQPVEKRGKIGLGQFLAMHRSWRRIRSRCASRTLLRRRSAFGCGRFLLLRTELHSQQATSRQKQNRAAQNPWMPVHHLRVSV